MNGPHEHQAVGGGGGFMLRTTRFVAGLAASDDDLRAAQRLRYRVFADELGARLPEPGLALDRDDLDPLCDHLLVRERTGGAVVGTYRMLPPERRVPGGGFYAEREFDLARLSGLSPFTIEVGRACVHPEFRSGAVIALLWAGLLRYVRARDGRYVMGCASVSLVGGHAAAAAVCAGLVEQYLGPEEWRVFPHRPFPIARWPRDGTATVPPLIKGYLRLGARVCGEAAWDEAFNTADLLLLLPMRRLDRRHGDWLLRLGESSDDAHSADAA